MSLAAISRVPRIRSSFFAPPFLGQNGRMRAAADTQWIVAKAIDLGFDLCGVVPVEDLADLANLEEWLKRGYAGEMHYLRDPRRLEISRVLPDAKSLVVCALNYNTGDLPSIEAVAEAGRLEPRAWISRYAWGDDYHTVMGEKLELLLAAMRDYFENPFHARPYVDTGPVSERLVAQKAGLGWQAKNTCLINEKLGSWFFLGVILTSLELAPPSEAAGAPADLCGNCRLCLDACPTEALIEPYVMDARRCISYLTIELRDSIPEELRAPMGWQVFGCDICQDVCPWNRKAPVTSTPAFQPREKLLAPELEWLLSLSEEEFRGAVFAGSPVRRAKWRGLVRNACVAAGNVAARNPGDTPAISRIRARLGELAASTDPLIAEHAAWALARMESVP